MSTKAMNLKNLLKKLISKKLIIFLVFTLFLFLGAGLFYLFPKDKNIENRKTVICIDSEIEKSVRSYIENEGIEYSCSFPDIKISKEKDDSFSTTSEHFLFYAPIVNLKNHVNSISEKELKGVFSKNITNWENLGGEGDEIKIFSLDSSENAELLRQTFLISNYDFERVDASSLISKIKENVGSIAFVPFSFIDPGVKTLKIDGNSPFNNQEEYFYRKTYFVQVKKHDNGILAKIDNYFNEQKGEIIEIAAVGDIMLSRNVGTKIRESGDSSLPFRKIFRLLSSSDITFGNLESPFYNQGSPVTEGMVFKAEPETIDGLVLAGFDIVSLANNHFGDRGRAGMEFTFEHLLENNILYCGAGRNKSQAHEYKTIKTKGSKISFLSYNEISPISYSAGTETPGLAWISSEKNDLLQMEKDIKKAKENSDFVFVSFHWGIEYTPTPTRNQKLIAQHAILAGADIIVAQHPHVVQEVEFLESRPVFYSLGNFVFDQMWSQETREGLIVKIYLYRNEVKSFDLIPVIIEDYNQPRLADEQESQNIKNRIFSVSGI